MTFVTEGNGGCNVSFTPRWPDGVQRRSEGVPGRSHRVAARAGRYAPTVDATVDARLSEPGDVAGRPAGDADDAHAVLDALRASIDNLDAAIVHLLAERFKCTQKVGALKAAHGMPASDPGREARQIERLRRLAREADLDPVFAERFLTFVIEEVIRHHRALAGEAAQERRPSGD